jgi:hypothetical protein
MILAVVIIRVPPEEAALVKEVSWVKKEMDMHHHYLSSCSHSVELLVFVEQLDPG